jgi:hypothetical protein
MRRMRLVLALAAMMALAGPSVANATQPEQESYADRVEARQYFAQPPSSDNPVGVSMFRGFATNIADDRDPGLPGQLDTRITYTGVSGPGVTNIVTGGAWMLCSQGFTLLPLDTTVTPPAPTTPECNTTGTPGSTIALQGTVSEGTAEWDETGTYATLPTGQVYAGVAKVNVHFTDATGTVDGVSVSGGSGKFKGTLDHRPLLLVPRQPPILKGTLELKLEF